MIIPSTWLAAGGLGIAVLSFWTGWQVQGWRYEAGQKAVIERAIKAHDKQQAKVHEESKSYEQDRETGRQEAVQRETTIREHYRTVEVPGACAAPEPVRSVLDNAVRSANARAGGQSGAGLSGDPVPAKPAD